MGLQGEIRDFNATASAMSGVMKKRRKNEAPDNDVSFENPATTSHDAGADMMQPAEFHEAANKGYRRGGSVKLR